MCVCMCMGVYCICACECVVCMCVGQRSTSDAILQELSTFIFEIGVSHWAMGLTN